jgi:transcriptional regulator with XRE-family HTH domain
LGERLRARRIAAAFLIKEVARRAGLKRNTVAAIEHGRSGGAPATLAKLARALGEL